MGVKVNVKPSDEPANEKNLLTYLRFTETRVLQLRTASAHLNFRLRSGWLSGRTSDATT